MANYCRNIKKFLKEKIMNKLLRLPLTTLLLLLSFNTFATQLCNDTNDCLNIKRSCEKHKFRGRNTEYWCKLNFENEPSPIIIGCVTKSGAINYCDPIQEEEAYYSCEETTKNKIVCAYDEDYEWDDD